MAHFAKISEENIVLTVLTLNNSDMLNSEGNSEESEGQSYLQQHNNWPGTKWIQTSYNTRGGKYYNDDNSLGDQSKVFRGNYAVVGMTWDADKNAFIPEKPYNSWVLSETTFTWEPPVSKPEQTYTTIDGTEYPDTFTWNESTTSWDKTEFSIKNISAEDDDLSLVNHLRV